MAKPLNKYQHEINAELNKLDKNFKNFIAKDFETDENAIMLERLIRAYEKYIDDSIIDEELFTDYNNLNTQIQEYLFKAIGREDFKKDLLWQAGDNRDDYDATAKFWGINRVSLIKKIKHQDYSLALMESHDHFHNPIGESYFRNRDSWVQLCNTIDKFVEFTKEKFPNWSTMKKSEKNQYIKYLEELADAPFLNDSENIKYYVQYLSKYGLNQSKKAKVKLLLQLNFPNIDDEKIAKEIIEYTNLFFFSKK